jgi:aspartyl-tRNA(Asn)/glutamyl-tRNA(Gln) amidotransferase subunit C
MKLSREDVLKLARLSKLKLSEQEIELYQNELSQIIDFVKQLDSADIEGLEPTYQVTGLTSADPNATRSDEVTEQISQEQLLKNIPKTEDSLIKVKRMIG